ncbi:MAG: ABC transporter ATP-binding protein [Anaerolineaceae bacterium]|jgi:osmoprotectant transport system ATP-binding protein|nr:ABC transporter ATP-binding protein [Anaerolineaceae bacterium]
MTAIRFEHVSKTYNNAEEASVVDVSLAVEQGSFVVLLGPSGCGKTTLLKMVNRLHEPTAGTIYMDNVDIREMLLTDLRRQIGYVIQQVGLFPHMTVARNISVVPELLGWEQPRIDARIDELLALIGMAPENFRDRYPAQLSGGQQQRIGLARALAADPKLMLMDEPFGAIDAINRETLQDEMISLQQKLHKTILFVTHDVDEALKLADKIVIMREGSVVQYASPCDILMAPANDFVANLMNSDDRIRQLSMLLVETVMEPLPEEKVWQNAPTLDSKADLRMALSVLLRPGIEGAVVVNQLERVGWLSMKALQAAGCNMEATT